MPTDKKFVIYLITNKINGKRYVGKTEVSLGVRWKRHLWSAENKPRKMPISAALKKYGPENFDLKILSEWENSSELVLAERAAIIDLGTKTPQGYNCTDGGEGLTGLVRSEQHTRLLSEAAKKRWAKPEFRASICAKMKRSVPMSEERREAIRQTLKRKYAAGEIKPIKQPPMSQESRDKMSESRKKIWSDPAHRALQSEKHKGKVWSAESRAKVSHRVLNSSPEYRAKMSASVTEMWRKRKAKNAA